MSESGSMRVKRGFHRLGIVLAILLGVCTAGLGAIISLESAASQRDRFVALQCADKKLKAKSDETSSAPAKITNDSEYDLLPLGSVFVGPDGKTRLKIPEIVPLHELGCGSSMSASRDEIAASRTMSFSYGTTIAVDLGVTALIAFIIALLGYLSVATVSWTVRGFMRGQSLRSGSLGEKWGL